MTTTDRPESQAESLESLGRYAFGWADSDEAGAIATRGLSEAKVREISALKNEPEWMLNFRLKGLRLFHKKPMPNWGADLSGIDFDNIKYFVRSSEKQATSWDDLPADIKNTYDRLGIPEAEKQRLIAGVAAQYESEVVYHSIREDLEEKGVLFLDTDTALREHNDLFQEYFGSVIPAGDNKFAALNTAVWSGGSFIYVPKGVHVDIPLQAYFRINTENMGQFERTLIIADEDSYVHYVEGCTAPVYSSDSLHSAVVEIIVKKNARVRYTTIQNWSNNVYNLVTKRALAQEGATMEWIDGNLGCLAEGSLVTTDRGDVAIEDLQAGDLVLAYDNAEGLCHRRVVAKKFSGNQQVREVRAGDRALRVTDNHPFLTSTSCGTVYVRADRLTEAVVPTSVALAAATHELAAVVGGGMSAAEVAIATCGADISLETRRVEVSEPIEVVPTWDIEVEGTGNFVSQGFIVHNSKVTMKYPAVWLVGEHAKGETLSVAFAGEGQHQDAGAKMVHAAPYTSSNIISKSVARGGGRTSYRGLVQVQPGSHHSKSTVKCDALLVDTISRSDTYPYVDVREDDVQMGHEATVSKVSENQLFYLMSRGLSEDEAMAMIVRGFVEPIARELPMEYALELNRLIELQMEGAVG
jgi:Fe-S cluster assembly scaffold protein SufB